MKDMWTRIAKEQIYESNRYWSVFLSLQQICSALRAESSDESDIQGNWRSTTIWNGFIAMASVETANVGRDIIRKYLLAGSEIQKRKTYLIQ